MRLILGLLVATAIGIASTERVICYFSSWAVWRPGDGKFDVEDIDPFLCTQLIFGFTGLSNQTWTIEVLDPWNELCPDEPGGNNCAFERFVALKDINPELTVMVAVGGWNEGSEDYSVMAADPEKRKTFVDSVVELVTKYGFEGLDVDWEYPGSRGGGPEDKENYIILLTELKEAFSVFNPPLMLTGAVPAGKPTIDLGYDISVVAELLDQVHLMSYDYFGAWANYTGHNAPLCGHWMLDNDEELKYFNIIFSVNYYLQNGVPPEKLVLGIATYGRCFTLDDIDDHGLFAPAHKPGPPGPYIRLPGTLGFNEICERVLSMDCTVVTDDPCLLEPYVYCNEDKIWCGFDDVESAATKARYAKNLGISGILIWQIDTDDFHPRCHDEPFPIIESAKRAVNAPADGIYPECQCLFPPVTEPTTATAAPTTTEEPTTTAEPTTTEEPTTTAEPTTTEEPTTIAEPTTTEEPTTTALPITTEEPTTTALPITTEEPTTTAEPTTTEKPTTTAEPTTAEPTTAEATTTTNGGIGSSSTHRPPRPKPDCSQYIDGSVFPHEDCNKYWVCVNGQAILELCAPGTLFDPSLNICNWEDAVDTTECVMWVCEVDNTYIPHPDCDKYYWCYQGSPHEEQCPDGTLWNQNLLICDDPTHVNTDNCNLP